MSIAHRLRHRITIERKTTGEDAWGQVALRGLDAIDPTYIQPGQKDKSDPLGQRGYIGSTFWSAAVVLNNGWMAVAECGATSL